MGEPLLWRRGSRLSRKKLAHSVRSRLAGEDASFEPKSQNDWNCANPGIVQGGREKPVNEAVAGVGQERRCRVDNLIEYKYGGLELFEETVPLRLKLLNFHAKLSRHFGPYYSPERIESTKGMLQECAGRGCLHIGLARHRPTGRSVGFCISTVNPEKVGEIFSLFVDDGFKSSGIGAELATEAVAWLRSKNPEHLEIHVLFENARVQSFYARLGFVPQTIVLREAKSPQQR
jgi:diamine N-acetyltransferase